MSQKTKNKAFFHIQNTSSSVHENTATDDIQWFVGNDAARGPWSEDACHAGPVTGIIARSLEQRVTDKQLFRLTVELLRPVPMSGFRIETEFRKQGRMITTAAATVIDQKGAVIATASSLHAQILNVGVMPTVKIECPKFDESEPGDFPVKETKHQLPFFSSGIEVRYPKGQTGDPGPTTVWMKTLPLLEDEMVTPFQRLCPLADCGNGISRNMEVTEANFLNPDITIIMHRPPVSDWLASEARSFWEPNGLGMAEATLFDMEGPIGAALQTLLVSPVK
jgi:hypothetical protein